MIKREMLPLRMDPQAKQFIESAAALMGTTANAFLLHHGYVAAKKVLEEDHLLLSKRDWNIFARMLEHPPKPNIKLKRLLGRGK